MHVSSLELRVLRPYSTPPFFVISTSSVAGYFIFKKIINVATLSGYPRVIAYAYESLLSKYFLSMHMHKTQD